MNAADVVAARAEATHHELQRPAIVGIAGAVAAGKSTFAAEVDDALIARRLRADIVSTDGFLFPTAQLADRGLLAHKGFPETYDVAAVRTTLTAVRSGAGGERVPMYSHELYDVEPGPGRTLPPLEVLVLEGVNAIGAAADLLDVAVYLDAAPDDLERWYVERFLELVEEARHDPASFYGSMTGLDRDEVEVIARSTWRGINLVNLRDHIAPTRDLADIVVVKGPDHRVVEVRDHAQMATDAELVDRLDEVWGSMSDLGDQLTEDEWKRPTEVPGWSVQDNLTHIAGMEAGLLGRPAPEHELPADLPHLKNEMGLRNEVVVDSRRAMSGGEALEEFREITRERIDVLRASDEAAFGAESWTPVGPGTVRDLLPFRVFDSWVHEQDMRRAVHRPGDLDSAVAAAALERIVGSMPFVVGKKAAAPDASTVVFDLDGPLARRVAIRVDGGRAKLADAAEPVTVRIATDTETFARLACGRIDAADELGSGRVRLEGDEALGRRVAEQMNFLF